MPDVSAASVAGGLALAVLLELAEVSGDVLGVSLGAVLAGGAAGFCVAVGAAALDCAGGFVDDRVSRRRIFGSAINATTIRIAASKGTT